VDECGLFSGVGNSKRLGGLKEFLFPLNDLWMNESVEWQAGSFFDYEYGCEWGAG
jgi:hypothetical protein